MFSNGPFFEDVFLHRCFGSMTGFAYAEFDPADPSLDSISQWFDLSGWRGMIAVTDDKPAWQAARPNAEVIGADEDFRPGAQQVFGFARFAKVRPDMTLIIGDLQPLIVVMPAGVDHDIPGYSCARADAARVYLVRSDHEAAWTPHFRSPLSRDEFRAADAQAAALGRMLAEREIVMAALRAEAARLHTELGARDEQIAGLDREVQARDREVQMRDREIQARDREVTARDQQIAALHDRLAARDAELSAVRPQAERLARLALLLDWPDGPRAVRMVLPLARLLRKLSWR